MRRLSPLQQENELGDCFYITRLAWGRDGGPSLSAYISLQGYFPVFSHRCQEQLSTVARLEMTAASLQGCIDINETAACVQSWRKNGGGEKRKLGHIKTAKLQEQKFERISQVL